MSRAAFVPALTLVLVAVLLILMFSTVVVRVQASQSSTIIRPNGDFVVALWNDGTSGCSTDSTRWNELTEDPPDGNTTCRATGTAGDVLQLSFEDAQTPARTIDIDVLVSITGRVTDGQTIRASFFSTAPCGIENEQPIPDINTSGPYVTFTALLQRCASTNNPTDPEWTEAFVNAMRADIDCVPTGTGLCFITQAFAEVRYTIQDEPGAPPPSPPPPLPEQVQQAAVGVAKEFCNLWLLLFLAAAIVVAYIIRRMKRRGDLPQ